MTTPHEVRVWAQSHGFTGRAFSHTHVRTMFLCADKESEGRVTHKVQLLRCSVSISALVKTPHRLKHFIKGPFMWRTVAFGYYKNLVVEGRRLKGLRLSRARV